MYVVLRFLNSLEKLYVISKSVTTVPNCQILRFLWLFGQKPCVYPRFLAKKSQKRRIVLCFSFKTPKIRPKWPKRPWAQQRPIKILLLPSSAPPFFCSKKSSMPIIEPPISPPLRERHFLRFLEPCHRRRKNGIFFWGPILTRFSENDSDITYSSLFLLVFFQTYGVNFLSVQAALIGSFLKGKVFRDRFGVILKRVFFSPTRP